MMWWTMWCAAVVLSGSTAAPATDNLEPLDLVQIDPSAPDDESLSYGLPPMGGRYTVGAPWLYLLADVPRDSQVTGEQEAKTALTSFFRLR